MRNVHSRVIDAPAHVIDGLLAGLATREDRVWPSPRWWPIRFDGPVVPGARGGHGPVRYAVEDVGVGRVRFRFDPRIGLRGYHEFTRAEDGGGRTVVTHVLEGRASGWMRVLWPLMVRWCHDELTEDALDNLEAAATGRLGAPRRGKAWARLWRRFLYDRPKRLDAIPEAARLAHGAFEKPDYWDSFAIPLRPGLPRDPGEWAGAIFFHKPFSGYGSADGEALIGDVKPVDFRVSILVEDERLVMSTVVRLRGPGERLYFRGVLLMHRTFVKFMLRRAVRRAGLAPRGTLVG
ncbi:hypothetical protein Afil01_46660 [Actinorhabdospora filicis]|uniref:DUF2867 domain-containing protein n=1 Tax=Actinorhabdospora filicis TaxID=1785913 RepID=A0A9W6SMX6_9ACTN|nr:hypothetical protein [Actinorhabdospora filicis]GLZ79859.1 hypothetical protein Afil01_46660 [Actinorhabdospora filicis]